MMRISHAGLVLAVGLAVSGCQRMNYDGGRAPSPAASQPAPLTAAPVGNVQQSQLPPPGGAASAESQTGQMANAPAAGDQQQMASLGTVNAPGIKPESMIGRWTITTGGRPCDLFLSMTKWTGGYRAATRNCTGTPGNISAWDVKGNRVVLSDNVGNELASVQKAGGQSYQGTTATGQPITLGR